MRLMSPANADRKGELAVTNLIVLIQCDRRMVRPIVFQVVARLSKHSQWVIFPDGYVMIKTK